MSHTQAVGRPGVRAQQASSVDGVFQMEAGVEPGADEASSNAQIMAAAADDESDEDLTYNS